MAVLSGVIPGASPSRGSFPGQAPVGGLGYEVTQKLTKQLKMEVTIMR